MGTIKLDHLRQTSMLQAASEHTTSEFTDPLLQTMNTIRRAASIMSSRTQSPVRISNESTSTEKPDKPLKPAHLSRSSTPEKPAKPIRISRDSESDEPTRNSSKSSPTSKLNKDYDTKDDSEAKAEAGYYHNNLNMTTGGIPMSESVDTHKRVESTVSRSHSTQPRLINTSTRSSAAFTEGKGNNTLQKRTSTSIVSSSDSEEKEPCMDTPSAKLSPRLKPTPPLDPPPTVSPRALQKSPRSDEKHKPIITAIAEAKQTKSATSNWVSASSVKLSSPSLRSIDREGFTDAESKDSGRVFQSTDPLIMQSNYMAELENSVTGHSRLKSHTGAVISKESNYKIKNNIDSSVVQPFSFDADDDNTISFSRSHGIKQRVEAKV